MKINATKFFGEIAIIFIGITLSFLTLPMWWYVLQGI